MSAPLAGTLGACLSMIGSGLYLRDVHRGHTVPHRGSWLVWGLIAVLAALSHGAAGGRWSLVVLGVQALATLVVLGSALHHGVGWFTPANLFMLAIAALGLAGWLLLTDPTAATACAAVADASGLLGIVPKAWSDPYSETMATYALAGVTGLLGAVAVQGWNLELLLFPIYFCLGNLGMAVLIILRRPRRWSYRQSLAQLVARPTLRQHRARHRSLA